MKIHYLDWAEKIRKKYSQIGEYGFAGATLTFLQGEKHSEPQNGGEERRLMLFFQNLIFCWENSIGVKLSIGNERVLEKSVRLALETAIQKLTSEEKTHFSREVKIARELLEGKEKTEIQMQKSLVFRRWQEGYSWEEISGHREIREYAERLEETRNRRQELARIRNREIARIQSKEMELAQIQNMKEVQNADETRIQNQYMRQHPGMEIRTNETKGSLLEKMQDQSNLVHREANETLGEREVRLNKTESQLETVRLEKREQESRLETIRLEKREQESQLETIRLEKREQESRLEIPSEKVQPEPRDTQPELQKMQTELNRQQEKLTETQIQLEKEAQILKHPENSLLNLEPEQKPEHPGSSLVYLELEQKPERPESSLLHRESKKAPDESGVQDRAKIQALEQEQEKKLSVRAEDDRLEIEKERVRTERQNQLETESRLERAIERQNRSEAESRLESAIERQNRSEAESRLESAIERQNRSESESRLESTTEWQNQDGEDISVDSKPFGEELTAEPAGMEEFEHPESSLVYLESKEISDGTGIQPRAEKRLELESSSEKAQPEPRDTQTELQKMQTELIRQQEKLTETQIQLEKEAQILKHPENSLVHLEPEQKPEHPESSLMHLEPEKKPEHPESSLVYLEPEQKPERPEGSLLHRKSKKAPDESRQDKAKILLNNLSESTSQRKKQPENRLFPGAVERMEKNVKTMEKVLERFHVVTETRKSVFSEPHIVEKHSNVRLEKLVSETLQQKQEKIRTAALQQNHRVRTIKRIIPRLEVLPGNREMRLEILETAEKTSGYETGQEFTSLPELSTTAKIQYTVPENRKTDRTNVGSEVSAISATLAQTREETRILRKNTGYTRTALIEQEKKIDGIRKELNTQMKQVNEEVRRLMDTQRRDMSVQNLAGKVMKELQRQFRTEKIRRGY